MNIKIFFALGWLCFSVGLIGCHSPGVPENTSISKKEAIDSHSSASGLETVRWLDLSTEVALDTTYQFLKNSQPYFISILANNHPRVRPIDTMTRYDDKIWFHIGQEKNTFKQLKKSPHIEIIAYNMSRNWIRITGEAVFSECKSLHEEAIRQNPILKGLYDERNGSTFTSFYIKDAKVEISSKPDGVIAFKL